MSTVSKEISRIWLYNCIPLGLGMIGLSHISKDPVTQEAVSQIREVNTKQGILQLDAHRYKTDIMFAMCAIAKAIPDLNYAAGMMTVKWVISGSGGELFDNINKHKDHLSIREVIRYEDVEHVSPEEYEQRKDTNQLVIQDFLNDINRPHAVGNLAPYGRRKDFFVEQSIRKGAIEMVRNFPSVCSLAKPSIFPPGALMYLSPLIEPMGNIPEENIRRHIHNSFEELRKRVGIKDLPVE